MATGGWDDSYVTGQRGRGAQGGRGSRGSRGAQGNFGDRSNSPSTRGGATPRGSQGLRGSSSGRGGAGKILFDWTKPTPKPSRSASKKDAGARAAEPSTSRNGGIAAAASAAADPEPDEAEATAQNKAANGNGQEAVGGAPDGTVEEAADEVEDRAVGGATNGTAHGAVGGATNGTAHSAVGGATNGTAHSAVGGAIDDDADKAEGGSTEASTRESRKKRRNRKSPSKRVYTSFSSWMNQPDPVVGEPSSLPCDEKEASADKKSPEKHSKSGRGRSTVRRGRGGGTLYDWTQPTRSPMEGRDFDDQKTPETSPPEPSPRPKIHLPAGILPAPPAFTKTRDRLAHSASQAEKHGRNTGSTYVVRGSETYDPATITWLKDMDPNPNEEFLASRQRSSLKPGLIRIPQEFVAHVRDMSEDMVSPKTLEDFYPEDKESENLYDLQYEKIPGHYRAHRELNTLYIDAPPPGDESRRLPQLTYQCFKWNDEDTCNLHPSGRHPDCTLEFQRSVSAEGEGNFLSQSRLAFEKKSELYRWSKAALAYSTQQTDDMPIPYHLQEIPAPRHRTILEEDSDEC